MSKSIAILGPGLIGGSLALALAHSRSDWRLSLWGRRPEALREAEALLPSCRVSSDLGQVVANADAVVICTTIGSMPELASQLKPLIRPDTIITDAGSVKSPVVEALEKILGKNFIGSHPMAGSEKSGLAAARTDLYHNAVCIMTPTALTSAVAHEMAGEIWKSAGCSTLEMSPEAHDAAIARVSHLPHAVAAALVHAVFRNNGNISNLAGSGYRDTTRIAGGPSAMWREILLDNALAVVAGINDMQESLETLKQALLRGDKSAVEGFLAEAASRRNSEQP